MSSRTANAFVYAPKLVFAMGLLLEAAAPAQTLLNHVPRAVSESRRLGPVSETANLNLAIGLPLRNRGELDQLVQQISDPQSASYRHYLSGSEFTDRFGPTQQDYDKLIAFVQENGLAVAGKHPNRMILDVSGPVGAINKTFHMTLTAWEHPERGRFFAPDRDPSLDSEVPVLDISGLDNFAAPRPMDLKWMPLASTIPFVSGSGPSGLFIGKDFRAAYAPGVAMTGAGQTIGLVEFDGFYAADVAANFQQAGLPPPSVQTVLLDGFNGAPGGGNIEVILDIAMAGYMAPGAAVIVYEGYSQNDVLNRMTTDNIAKQLSCSWGYPINATTEQIFKQMIAQGQSFFTASGDSGAYTGAIMTPSDDPNVTSVGGTALNTTGPGGSWLSESAWSGSGGGVSTTYPIPSYQQNLNLAAQGGSNSMRNMPDVALTGAQQMFLICNNGQWIGVGGTSAATPLWAAFTALVNQQATVNLKPVAGFLNPALYALGKGSGYGAALHDITTGSNGFPAIPGYDLSTGWGTPTGQPLINYLASVPSAPSFVLSATALPGSLQAGSSTTSSIQVTAQNGFSGTVTLSVSGLPSGVTGTFGALSAGKASTLTLTAASAATPGTYSLSVQGVSGTLTASAPLSLVVTAAAGYRLTTSAATLAVAQSTTGTASIAIVPTNGFNSAVSLTISGLPSGVTASFSPASTATTSTLSFVASASAAIGTATVTITGKSGSLSTTVAMALTVAAPAAFSMTASAPTLSIVQGASGPVTITIVSKSGFTGKVTLTTPSLAAGVTASFNPASTATTSVATFTATSAAAVGTTTVTVLGTSGTSSASVTVSLTVKAGPSFTLAAAPASLSVIQGGSGTSTITVTPLNGFTGAPTMTVGALPAGVTATVTAGTLKFSATATAVPGPATVTITATSGAISAQTAIALTVAAAPGFKLSSSAPNVNVAPGSTGSATISVVPQTGFGGTVVLTAAGLPAGVTASFSPASTAANSTLTLTATSAAAAKVSQFTVNGISGSLAGSITLTVTVTPQPDFAIALAPSSLRLLQGGKGSSAILITPVNGIAGGFAGNVTLAAAALPSGVTASFSSINSGLILGLFTVSSSAVTGTTQVNITATSGALSHSAAFSLTIAAPTAGTSAVDLSPSYNVSGSAVDNLVFTSGGLDALGRSYSGMLLGASQSAAGTLFSLGPMGLPDAVSGQTVTLPAAQFTSLKMLATGVNGNQPAQTFTVTYTDGSTTVFTQSLSDWYTPQQYPGESQAVTTNYRDNSTGTTDGRVFYVYGYSFALNATKTVRSIRLPQSRNVVVLAITMAGRSTAAVTF